MFDTMIGPNRIVSALSYIPASDRDTWLKMGMALKSELSDEEGFSIWSDWSQSDDSYNDRDAKAVWRGIKNGEITIGTLFYLAKDSGWQDTGDRLILSPVEIAKKKADREAALLVQQAQDQAKHKQAAAKAKELDSQATRADDSHPYLVKKGIKAHKSFKVYRGGLLIDGRAADGALMVAMGDEHGLSGLEFIWEDRTKRPLPSANYKGKYFRFGAEPTEVLNICEGISTAASIFEATGTPTFCARSCSNLKNVALALQKRYPQCAIRVCGDIGNGEQDAIKAAQTVGGSVVMPLFKSNEGTPTDFNDLHQIEGLAAVKAAIDGAIQKSTEQTGWQEPETLARSTTEHPIRWKHCLK